ncbi:Protein aardvark [Hondaea fermentalgiana]|uniref:Protein aardvark n=1 Tax=Hondaea fermentalgiana TaxID=2315210 RepID=A0A2R5GL73_9STRA|nr:Protein aardvark [Hondaea fermentalgiana]|eukprot:GBG29373.1 Protein aardvark [Hondaea fermentalgiana]
MTNFVDSREAVHTAAEANGKTARTWKSHAHARGDRGVVRKPLTRLAQRPDGRTHRDPTPTSTPTNGGEHDFFVDHAEIDALLREDDGYVEEDGDCDNHNDFSKNRDEEVYLAASARDLKESGFAAAPLTREDLDASTFSSLSSLNNTSSAPAFHVGPGLTASGNLSTSSASASSSKENRPQVGHEEDLAASEGHGAQSATHEALFCEQGGLDAENDAPSSGLAAQLVPKREELRDRLAFMLETERRYQVQDDYIESVQMDGMRPVWRRRLFEWMFEFVDEYDIGICTVTTAMNYVDRYLSHVSTKKCILQLVALAAILIATKLCETRPISIQELQGLAEGIYLESDIRLMELELLRVLAWELNPVTPFAFLRHLILYFDSVDRNLREKVLSFAETFLEIVLCEYVFVQFSPSETATASLLCAFDICNCRCTALGTSLGAVHPGRVASCKAILLKYVREVFPEYFRAEDVVTPDCVADIDLSKLDQRNNWDESKRVWTFCYGFSMDMEIIATMRTHRKSDDVLAQACDTLGILAAKNDHNKLILGQELDVGKEIIASMCEHRAVAIFQEKACVALCHLAANDRNKVILGQELNVGTEILAAMRANPWSPSLQEKACMTFYNLAVNDRNKVILGQELEVGKEIVLAMRAHSDSASLQEQACKALSSLAAWDRNKEILGQKLEVDKEIVAAMLAHPGNASIQEQACSVLLRLTENERNKKVLGQKHEVVKAILAAMSAHLTSAVIQEKACRALWNLASIESNRAILGQELEVGENIVAAMRAHPGSSAVQYAACAGLMNLTLDDQNCLILEQKLGIVKVIVAAMTAHIWNGDIQEVACEALRNIATNDKNDVILGQEFQVGEAIVAAMRAHLTSKGVQENACGALWQLAANDARNKVILGQNLEVGKHIVAAMREHVSQANLQANACGALWSLAANDRNKAILGQELEAGNMIVAAMRAHPASASVQMRACGSLWNLAFDTCNREMLWRKLKVGKEIVAAMRAHIGSEGRDLSGRIKSLTEYTILGSLFWLFIGILPFERNGLGRLSAEIVSAMRSNPGSADVQEDACSSLVVLAADDHNKVTLGQELEVGRDIVAAMRNHLGSANLQEIACFAVMVLAANVRNKEILGGELEVGDEIVAAMRMHPGSADVQEVACWALERLAANDRNKAILGQDLEATEAIVAATRAHPGVAAIQRKECGTLWNLAHNGVNETLTFDTCNEIVAVMRAHPENENLQRSACKVLDQLAVKDRIAKFLGQELGVGSEIVTAMRAHSASKPVQEEACRVLSILSRIPSVKIILRYQGALHAVEKALNRFESLSTAALTVSKLVETSAMETVTFHLSSIADAMSNVLL